MRASFALCAIIALIAQVDAASIKWTGYASNGQWDTPNNWYPNSVPGAEDDVTINKGSVTITTPVVVNSIGMGNEFSNSANLTVDSSLTVGTLTVDGNGNLILPSGASAVSGTVNVGGFLSFTAGSISGTWTVSKSGVADLTGAGEKAFVGCGFSSAGSVSASGVVVLNQSSQVSFTSDITASGNFMIQAGDTTSVLFDTSMGTLTYTGDGTFSVQAPLKLGTFNFQGGNLTLIDSVTFANAFAVPSGSVVRSLGPASVSIPEGVTGSGLIHAEGVSLSVGGANFSGTVNAQAGTFSFSSKSFIDTLLVTGSSVQLSHSLDVNTLSLQSGSVDGSSTLTAASANILTAGFTINASVVFTGAVTCTGSTLSFQKPGMITVASGAVFTAVSSVQFAGPAGTGGFVNNGILAANGAVDFQNIDISGTGSVTVTDSLHVNTITISQSVVALSGNGVFKGSTTDISMIGSISGSPSVAGSIGSYSFSCPKECKDVKTVGIPTSKFHFAVGK